MESRWYCQGGRLSVSLVVQYISYPLDAYRIIWMLYRSIKTVASPAASFRCHRALWYSTTCSPYGILLVTQREEQDSNFDPPTANSIPSAVLKMVSYNYLSIFNFPQSHRFAGGRRLWIRIRIHINIMGVFRGGGSNNAPPPPGKNKTPGIAPCSTPI